MAVLLLYPTDVFATLCLEVEYCVLGMFSASYYCYQGRIMACSSSLTNYFQAVH